MSNVVPFDTLALAQALRDEAGFDQKQAEGTAKVFARVLVADLATKSDLANVATKADLAETKADILKWMFGAMGFQTLAIIGAVVVLLKLLGH